MTEWVTPQTIFTLAGALAAVAVAWGNLRTLVVQQAKQHALEREELRTLIRSLRTDLDAIRLRNGSPRVMDEISELKDREDSADDRAAKWVPVITALRAQVEAHEKEIDTMRHAVADAGTRLAEVKARQEVQRRPRAT
jgi:uncharacterized coiled-coil DUF342 family protein